MNLVNGISSLARASARRPWLTIGMWVVGLIAAVAFMITGNALVTKIDVTNNPESKQADQLITDRLTQQTSDTNPLTEDETIIIKSDTLTIDSPEYRTVVENLYKDLIGLGDKVVVGGVNYYMTFDASLVSADRHSTMIPLVMVDKAENYVDQVYAVGDKLVADNTQFKVYYTGTASFNADTMALAENTMSKGESIGIMVALVVLAVVFGALVAALLPIALGIGVDPSFRAPMAIVVIGGLVTSTFLSLLVIPVLFTYVDDVVHWVFAAAGIDANPRH